MHGLRSRLAPTAVAVALACCAVAGGPAAGDVDIETGTLEHFGTTYAVEFGTFRVPANRNDPDSKPIALKFVRYKSESPAPGHPIVYLAGGPGGSGISTMASGRGRVFLSLLDGHDVIGFDQRGTGQSEPRDVTFEVERGLPLDEPGDPQRYGRHFQDAARRMLATMKERGIDVAGLTTRQSAADLDDLRKALGAEKLILWGSSYGTHLALATARYHADAVAALILAGTEGPDQSYKLPSNIEANLRRLADEFREPLRSDIPVLFMSGTLDGRTPISNAREIAEGFPNSAHLVITNASHGGDLFTSSPRILESVRAFLRGETLPYSTIEGPEWHFQPPYEKSLAREMLEVLTSEGYDAAVARYHALRERHEGGQVYDFREQVLNELGYGVMRAGMTDLAIDVFRLNTVAYPEAFNTWDSLAEGLMNKGELEQAVTYYRKSLELNPDNANAVRMLERIRERLAE